MTTEAENIDTQDLSDIKETSIPISTELLREYFKNKDMFFLVNYSTSKLKEMQFLTYLTNLGINFEICFELNEENKIDYKELSELLKAWMNQINICNSPFMSYLAFAVIHYRAYGKVVIPINHVGDDFYEKFCNENSDLVDRWIHFIDSTQAYVINRSRFLNEHYKPKENLEVISDTNYVHANIALLFGLPIFTGVYFAEKKERKVSWFEKQFEEPMFSGNYLDKYFFVDNNFIFYLASAYQSGHIKIDDVKETDFFSYGLFKENTNAYIPPEEAIQVRQSVESGSESSNSIPSESQSGTPEGMSV